MIEQGTPEWHQERCGKITASRFADVLAVLKSGKPSEARAKYMREIVFEVISSTPIESINAAALSWGKDIEMYAREAYELYTGNIITTSGFTLSLENKNIGSSPDGLVDDDGGIEIKCPKSESVHIQTLLEGMPQEHYAQVQGNMYVTGRKWWDFVSFDPRQSEGFRIYIERINRDEEYIEKLKSGLESFWTEVCETVCVLKTRKVAA